MADTFNEATNDFGEKDEKYYFAISWRAKLWKLMMDSIDEGANYAFIIVFSVSPLKSAFALSATEQQGDEEEERINKND